MNKIKSALSKTWNYLSGKKRNIALIYWSLLLPATTILWPEGPPIEIAKTSSLIGLILSYLGLGHAAVKKVQAPKHVPETDEIPNKGQ